MSSNPFQVFNPEQLDAAGVARSFVDVFTDLPRLRDRANTFILGARGTGKSMLLRSLEPAVMLLLNKATSLKELPHFAVHVPLKKAEFAPPELQRLAGYAGVAVGEHLLVMHVVYRVSQQLVTMADQISADEARKFSEYFFNILCYSGGEYKTKITNSSSVELLEEVCSVCEMELMRVRQFYTRLPFSSESKEYAGALTGYIDFLVPLLSRIRKFDALPDVPAFIMLDDADNLPKNLQRVLNSWVSTRSTDYICLKITTQLGYATYKTTDGRIVESPHDFSEVNLSTIYTRHSDSYWDRVSEIVTKRLRNTGIASSVHEFFPGDTGQSKRLKEIASEIRQERASKEQSGEKIRGSSRIRDEVTRQAVPRLMRELAGASKSSHTFSYAGFDSLVDLSSGVVRWFLEPASRMYDEVVSRRNDAGFVSSIPVSVQDAVIGEWSREFLDHLELRPEMEDEPSEDPEASLHAIGHETELYTKLRNLIEGLGRLFRKCLLTEDKSERRVFSFALRDRPSVELQRVLDLAVRLGYMQRSDIASKEALGGRMPRYILARRLGPYYRLDVSGYAAHLSMTSKHLELSFDDPNAFVAARLNRTSTQADQLKLGLNYDDDDALS